MSLNRFLVLGGAGLIGSHLVSQLLAAKKEVSIFDHFSFTTFAPMSRLESNSISYRFENLIKGAEIFRGSTTRKSELLDAVMQCQPECVIHLATSPLVALANSHPEDTRCNILGGTANALETIVRQTSIRRFVYVSSSMVYGDFQSDPIMEDSEKKPVSIYGALKLSGELLTNAYLQDTQVQPVIVRPSAVYGPGDVNRRVVQIFCENAITNRPLEVIQTNDMMIDFTYVEDLVQGLVLAATHDDAAGKTFNLANGEARSIHELANIVSNAAGIEVETIFKNKEDKRRPKRGALDISLARELLGFNPVYRLENGVKEYFNFIRDNLNG